MGLGNIPVWWEIGIVLVVFFLLVYWDVISRPRRWLWARILVILVAVLSLFGLYTEPYKRIVSEKEKLVWVTDNEDKGTLDSLLKSGFKEIRNLQMYEASRSENGVDQLVVLGNGLEEWELQKVHNIDAFYPSKNKEEGVIDFTISQAVEQSPVQFSFQLKLDSSLALALSGSGIETVTLETDQDKATLEVLPTISGYLTYQLDGIRSKDTIFSETLPMRIYEKRQTNVLMISNSPSFEFRGIKNYLAEEGFGIAERQQISTDLFHEAFTNISERRLNRLSNRLLNEFQLILISSQAYNGLSRTEQERIKFKVQKGSLGLVLMGGKGANALVNWQPNKIKSLVFQGNNGEVKLTGSNWKMATDQHLTFNNKKIVQLKSFGLGSIVRPLFTDSYILNLQAENKLYANLWQRTLEGVVGSLDQALPITTSRFPRVNETAQIKVKHQALEELTVEDIRLATNQEWFAPKTWTSSYWPQKRGWQNVKLNNEGADRFFVFDSTDWQLQKQRMKQLQTAGFVNQKKIAGSNNREMRNPISKWIFFIGFLLGMTFLWVEQRVG